MKGKILADGAQLWVNRGLYTVTVVPPADLTQIFTNYTASWDGQLETTVSSSTTFGFTMKTNYTLNANFIHNPYYDADGVYYGLFTNTTSDFSASGFVTAKVDAKRGYSGVLYFDGDEVKFAGVFPLNGITNGIVVSRAKAGKDPITLDLNMVFAAAGGASPAQLKGTVHVGAVDSSLIADQSSRATQFSDAASLFTAALSESSPNIATAPGNYGYLTVSVLQQGLVASKTVVVKGGLSDGAAVGPLGAMPAADGRWPFFAKLYAAKAVTNAGPLVVAENLGAVMGWLQFTGTNSIGGTLTWTKTANANADPLQVAKPYTTYYTAGFTNTLTVTGKKYIAPATPLTQNLFTLDGTAESGTLTLDGGDVAGGAQSATLNITAANKTLMTSTNVVLGSKLSVSFVPKDGSFSGSYMNGLIKVPFAGAVLQEDKTAYGFFDGTTQSGSVVFTGN